MAEIRLKSTGTIKLFENDNTSNVTIASPASLGADRTVTLPDADVTLASGTMLATDGSGASLTALNASELGSGTVPTARLGSGTASSSTVLYGDQTYKTEPGLTGWTTGGTSNSLIPSATDQGIYLGVSSATAANLLDDYEEGTWTPAWEPATSGSVTSKDPAGTYTKIGNIVYFLCRNATNGSSSPVGDLKISGLPFTQAGGPGGNEGGGPIVACDTWTSGEFPTVFKCASSGTDEAFMMQRGASDGQIVVMDSATMAINYNYSSFSAVGLFKT